ncbi:MAG TPA: DUF1003 domain-containing protein [Candidatus Saccharimonadales bacterium]|nr:DUF1003 domain-containing protein [Candidatus Saccharimonadales bacterium]
MAHFPLVTRTPRNWHKEAKANLTRGERAADKMRNGMGSWLFVFLFLSFMGIWAILNTVGMFHHWDKYPFILLNLFLSMLAGLQGAILLIAAKRADAVSAAMAKHDYDTNLAAKAEIEALMEINQRQLEIIEDLQKLLKTSGKSK